MLELKKEITSKPCLGMVFLFVGVIAAGIYFSYSEKSQQQASPIPKAKIVSQFVKLPLNFETNKGQTDSHVKYLTRSHACTFYFTSDEIIMSLPNQPQQQTTASVLKMQFIGANKKAFLTGLDEQLCKSNYFIGNQPQQWYTNISNYAKVAYQNLYPNIDAVFYGNLQQLEYDLYVRPGGHPNDVRLHIEHSKELFLDESGVLHILTESAQDIQMQKPFVYQIVQGEKVPIESNFVLLANNEIGFSIGSYDASSLLVIDPILTYSTYLGGSNADFANGIAVDPSGSAYITGLTASLNFPTQNPFQPTLGGSVDAFVTKFNPAGTALVYSSYLGGKSSDEGASIAIDSGGNAYVTGQTSSTDFPIMNAFQLTLAGSSNAFVTKFDPTGSALVYSTYLGGSSVDFGRGIAVDSSGSAYVTGGTNSNDFPNFVAIQPTLAGGDDAFITKFDPSGTTLIYSTYLGGSNNDNGTSISLDNSGNAYVTGQTSSTDFPTQNPFQPNLAGSNNAFVTKFNSAGTALVYSTYLGGSNADIGFGIAVDSNNNAYVTGQTGSADFPTVSPYQPTLAGGLDVFVTKFNPAGSALVYSTFLGGSSTDFALGIALDSNDSVYVTGSTSSSDFPTINPFQALLSGPTDAFLTKFAPSGANLIFSTYLGGNADENGQAIAVDSIGNAYVAGLTTSADFPTQNPFQATSGGSTDAFITKLNIATPTVTNVNPNFGPVAGGNSVAITGSNFDNVITVNFGANAASFIVNSSSSITAIAPAGFAGTVDVTVTTSGGTSPITPNDQYTYQNNAPIPPLPPTNFIGIIYENKFLNRNECIVKATWEASPSSNVIFYRIYKKGNVIATLLAGFPLMFVTGLQDCSAQGFEIAAVDSNGLESNHVKLISHKK